MCLSKGRHFDGGSVILAGRYGAFVQPIIRWFPADICCSLAGAAQSTGSKTGAAVLWIPPLLPEPTASVAAFSFVLEALQYRPRN